MRVPLSAFAIYGFGRAGRSLAFSLSLLDGAEAFAFCRKTSVAQREFAAKAGIELFEDREDFLHHAQKKADVLFIAVSDDSMASVALQLASEGSLPGFVAHLSGVFSSDILDPLSVRTSIAQFHPLASLDGAGAIPPNTFFAVNAQDERARAFLMKLATDLGCNAAFIKNGDQELYHAAAVLTGNLSLGLVNMSQKMLQMCGVEEGIARLALAQLLKSAALSLEKNTVAKALTGPVSRGDVSTIKKHVRALERAPARKEFLEAYRLLTAELLECVELAEEARADVFGACSRTQTKNDS